MRVGAHISSSGGPQNVFSRAGEIGAEAIQLFISAPRQWRPPNLGDEAVAAFRTEHERMPVPVFFHGVYLVNLGTQDEKLLNRSAGSLKQYVKWAGDARCRGHHLPRGQPQGGGLRCREGPDLPCHA